jgi:class 3 adenylate cyclase
MRPLDPGLRLLTLLFTDAVSSTEQLIRIGDHQADALRRERDAIVAREVERAHGTVVKSTGDGTFAVFVSPSEAISCSVAVLRSLAQRNFEATEPIGLRVGLATGEVMVEEDDVYGRAANESARITALAQGGEILCCALTSQLAAPRSHYRIESVGEVQLKGFDAPAPLFRVDWAEVSEPLVPLPAALARRPPFVGRGQILAAAHELWTRTTSTRRPHMLILGGEPGVGKTSVLARLSSDLFQTGATVLYGRCSENEMDSLRPVREALTNYVRTRGMALGDEFGPHRRELARLVPELEAVTGAPSPKAIDPRVATASLFDAVAQWFVGACRQRPVLFVLDDAEWLDPQTAALIRWLAEEAELGALLLAVAYRDHQPTATGEVAKLMTSLRSTAGSLQATRLGGLSGQEAAELVGLLEPGASDRAEQLHRDSGGNPLYLSELLRTMQPGMGVASHGVGSPDISELVLRRVDALPTACVELLEAAAVLGQEFDVAAIEQMLTWPTDDTYKVLDDLVRNDLLREPMSTDVRFEFSHAIVREQVYDRLTKVRRLANHRRAADTLEHLAATGRPVPAREIARHHLEAATSSGLESALKWCRQAAHEATGRMAYEEAGHWFESGLDLFGRLHPAESSDYLELLIDRAVASQQAGERGTRRRFLRAADVARRLDDRAGLIRVALSFDRGFFADLGRADEARITLLREALSSASSSPSERACLLALLASELTWDDPGDTRFAMSDEALELARHTDDMTLLRVLSLRPPTIWSLDTHQEVVASVDELGSLTSRSGDPVLKARYLIYRFGAAAESGNFQGLPEVVENVAEIGAFLRLPDAIWHATVLRANLALFKGQLSDARALAQQSLEWGQRAHQPEAILFWAAVEMEVRRLAGGLDEVTEQLRMGRSDTASGGYSATRFLFEAGHAMEAREDYARAVRTRWTIPRTIHGGPTLVNLSYLASRFEDVRQADHFLQLLEPYRGRFFQAITTHHVTDHYCGMLAATAGHTDRAAASFRAAVDAGDAVGAPLLAAESRLEWARLSVLDRSCPGPPPIDLVDAAISAADSCGATALVERALDLRSAL